MMAEHVSIRRLRESDASYFTREEIAQGWHADVQ